MRRFMLPLIALVVVASCNSNEETKGTTSKEKGKYTLTKDGIEDLKIGMKKEEVEKLLGQQFTFNEDKEDPGYWQDTVKTKYKDIDVALYFWRQYVDEDSTRMELAGIETSSPLVRTSTGIGVGDDKSAIVPAYDDNPIVMGPESEMVNDTTWVASKTKFTIYVRDDKYDKDIIFHLTNKKVSSLEASILMGE